MSMDNLNREDRPAYIRFERRPMEDRAASIAAGHYVAKDVDYALVTPPYSRDVFVVKVSQWLLNIKQDLDGGRIKQEWYDRYLKALESWKLGEEIPLHGIPIKGWGVISPAQQENLTRINILTVEDLAAVNDEGIRRIGMGAMELRDKAKAWLMQLNDKGPLTQKIAALESENRQLTGTIAGLNEKVQGLLDRLAVYERQDAQAAIYQQPYIEKETITAADIMDDEPKANAEIPKRKPRGARTADPVETPI